MGQKELTQLADELAKNEELRSLFARDPEAAAKQAGITLDAEDHETLRNLGVHEMDEAELTARISKRDLGARR
jgi:hypothetical protein